MVKGTNLNVGINIREMCPEYTYAVNWPMQTDQPTPWSWALLEKQPVLQLLKTFLTFYGTRRFISVHKSYSLVPVLSQMNAINTIQTYLRSILILSYQFIRIPSNLFSSGFPINILYAFPFFSIRSTCSDHLILLDFIILGQKHKLWSALLFIHPHANSFIFSPNILRSSLFSNKSMYFSQCQRLSFTYTQKQESFWG
jgi:hypothetical protein